MVPDRLNALAGALEPAQLVSSRVLPPAPVLQGPKPQPITLWRVRYSDGLSDEVPQDAIRLVRSFRVVISERATSFEAPVEPGDPQPVLRRLEWTGEAANEGGATLAARAAWNEKYGGDSPPRGGDSVEITPL